MAEALRDFLDRDTKRSGEKAKTDVTALLEAHKDTFTTKHRALITSTLSAEDYGFCDKNWTSLYKAIQIVLAELTDYTPVPKPALRKKRKAESALADEGKAAPPATGGGQAEATFAALPKEKYELIYCDPPWQYNIEKGKEGMAARHYKTVSIDELCSLDVPSICEKNSVIVMWATWPKIQEALKLMSAWGFEYVTALMVWLKLEKSGKPRLNVGWWLRSNTEFMIVGKRGQVTHLKNLPFMTRTSQIVQTDDGVSYDFAADVPVIETVGRGVHSRKPEEARRILEAAFRDAKKIELFARGHIEGWATWGNQTEVADEGLGEALKQTDAQNAVSPERLKSIQAYYDGLVPAAEATPADGKGAADAVDSN